jgi:hypothetical protein
MSEEFTSRRLSKFGSSLPSLMGGADPSPRQGGGGARGGVGGAVGGGVALCRTPPARGVCRMPWPTAAECVHNPRACMPASRFSCRRSCLELCARSRASLPAGFSTCTIGRPTWSAAPLSIVHEPGRPLCGRRRSCCAVACPAVHEPVGAHVTRRGNVLCCYVRSRARPAPA